MDDLEEIYEPFMQEIDGIIIAWRDAKLSNTTAFKEIKAAIESDDLKLYVGNYYKNLGGKYLSEINK